MIIIVYIEQEKKKKEAKTATTCQNNSKNYNAHCCNYLFCSKFGWKNPDSPLAPMYVPPTNQPQKRTLDKVSVFFVFFNSVNLTF